MMRVFAVIGLLALMVGCASTEKRVAPTVSATDKPRQASLKNLRQWVAAGRISVVTDDDAWHGNLHWRQTGAQVYAIRIIAPLGQGTVLINGSADSVTLRSSDGKNTLEAETPEELLEHAMGWKMPLSGMRYWLFGIISPNKVEAMTVDETGRPATLAQLGWQIKFSEYRLVDRWYVPGKIELENGRIKVKMLIQTWKLEV